MTHRLWPDSIARTNNDMDDILRRATPAKLKLCNILSSVRKFRQQLLTKTLQWLTYFIPLKCSFWILVRSSCFDWNRHLRKVNEKQE